MIQTDPDSRQFRGLVCSWSTPCLALAIAVMASECTWAQTSVGIASTGNMQSATERAIDYLDQEIAPPDPASQTGFAMFGGSEMRQSAVRTGAKLVLVISVFLILIFLWRLKSPAARADRRRRGQVPAEVVSVIGQIPFVHGQQLQLVRLGSRLLLVATSPQGSHTLGEIVDAEEVLQIETACRTGRVELISDALRTRATESAPRSRVSLGSARQERSGRTLLEA